MTIAEKGIEPLLLEAVKKTQGIVGDPAPVVLLKGFNSYATV
ncbi:MAG: hypothetical protein ACJ71B_00730 [Nitrososphaera sp.]